MATATTVVTASVKTLQLALVIGVVFATAVVNPREYNVTFFRPTHKISRHKTAVYV